MNREFNGFDDMVEALEENEDMVECKECFDLFPKAECERSEVGYVCPICKGLRTAPARARFVDPYDSYTQEFPEVQEYDPDSMVEYEKEPGLGDALADLIKDEYEAIDGYEVADETIQHADIDEDEKDEILDTLDHIKEEEEEHIDELKELCPECDTKEEPTDESEEATEKLEEAADDEEAAEEAEVEEIPEEDIPEEETEDSEENENEEVSDLDSAYEAALEIANESGVGQVFGYAKKETEEFVAIEPFEVDDPEAVEEDLMAVYDDVAYAYVAYPEKSLEESLFESVQLNEGPGRLLKGLGRKMSNTAKHLANRNSGKLLDKFFTNGYIIVLEGPKPKDNFDAYKQLHKSEWSSLEEALNEAYYGSQDFPQHKVWVFAKPLDETNLTPRERTLAKASNGLGPTITGFVNGKAEVKRDKELADAIQKIEIDKKDRQRVTGKSGSTNRDPRDSLGNDEEEEEVEEAEADTTGEKPAGKDEEKPVGEGEEDKDPNLDDDEDPRDKAKQMLGEKKASDGYTPESYKKYEAAYAKILAWIEAHPKPAALTQERIDNLKNQAEAKLKEVEDADPDLNDDETEDSTETSTDTGTDNKTDDETDGATDETGETTEEPADETPDGETAETTGEVKLSEVSEEQLKKLFTAVTGQGVGDNKKWQKIMKRMRSKLQELGEDLESDTIAEEKLREVLQSEAEAVKSLKDTAASLKATASSMQNMTSAMREEYHKYANPAELKAMEDIENLVSVALSNIYNNLATWGYNASETDSQCFMSQENEACLQYMIDFDGLDENETEDLADQLKVQLENELSAYKPVPEIEGIAGSIALPDYDIAYDDDEEGFEGITRASIMVYVTFARNLY